MYRRFLSSLLGMVLIALSGAVQAQCENMRVIVRNSVHAIHGLEAFCTEFNKLKADVASMRSELSVARRENAVLRARLEAAPPRSGGDELAWTIPLARTSKSGQLPR